MKTFIVHIYTCTKSDLDNFVGIAEEVGSDGKKAFTNPDDLLKIMSYKEIIKDSEESLSS